MPITISITTLASAPPNVPISDPTPERTASPRERLPSNSAPIAPPIAPMSSPNGGNTNTPMSDPITPPHVPGVLAPYTLAPSHVPATSTTMDSSNNPPSHHSASKPNVSNPTIQPVRAPTMAARGIPGTTGSTMPASATMNAMRKRTNASMLISSSVTHAFPGA